MSLWIKEYVIVNSYYVSRACLLVWATVCRLWKPSVWTQWAVWLWWCPSSELLVSSTHTHTHLVLGCIWSTLLIHRYSTHSLGLALLKGLSNNSEFFQWTNQCRITCSYRGYGLRQPSLGGWHSADWQNSLHAYQTWQPITLQHERGREKEIESKDRNLHFLLQHSDSFEKRQETVQPWASVGLPVGTVLHSYYKMKISLETEWRVYTPVRTKSSDQTGHVV